jgi:hypothetical protein
VVEGVREGEDETQPLARTVRQAQQLNAERTNTPRAWRGAAQLLLLLVCSLIGACLCMGV